MADHDDLVRALATWPTTSIPRIPIKSGCWERLRCALIDLEEKSQSVGVGDIAGLLRHALQRQDANNKSKMPVRVPAFAPWPKREIYRHFGIDVDVEDGNYLRVSAHTWTPEWLGIKEGEDFLQPVFDEKLRRPTIEVPSDPAIEETFGPQYANYTSPGQRAAVRGVFCSEPGSTIIVNLPTGMGKSLVAIAPSIISPEERKVSIVVVPTVALAMDQEKQVKKMLAATQYSDLCGMPFAWHGGLSDSDKDLIRGNIANGKQPILFASPESLLKSLTFPLYRAAECGYLKYFVIDEVHMVSQWGTEFRPAFQSIAGLRKGLMNDCPKGECFRTILMSATLTGESYDAVINLYGPEENIKLISSSYLRHEPSYWVCKTKGEPDREEKISEAIRMLPRPFILYVTTPEQTEVWMRILSKLDIRRVGCVHGKTESAERQRVIESWSSGKIDVAVGTSAFGLGIDKSDVKAVVHACLPENVDRFYQEVGRGGRDGTACLSLLVYDESDIAVANSINSKKIISVEKGVERWKAMVTDGLIEACGEETVNVKTDIVPGRLKGGSAENSLWNIRTLNLMARTGLIEIESERPPAIKKLEGESEIEYEARIEGILQEYFTMCPIRIKDARHSDADHWKAVVEPVRQKMWSSSEQNLKFMLNALNGREEFSRIFCRAYEFRALGEKIRPERACGGCPICRARNEPDDWRMPPETVVLGFSHALYPGRISSVIESFGINNPGCVLLYYNPPIGQREIRNWGKKILKDVISPLIVDGIKEISAGNALFDSSEFRNLFRDASDGFLFCNHIDDDTDNCFDFHVPRVTLLSPDMANDKMPGHLFLIDRPLHIIVLPSDMPDSDHPYRKFIDTAKCISLNTFMERFRKCQS